MRKGHGGLAPAALGGVLVIALILTSAERDEDAEREAVLREVVREWADETVGRQRERDEETAAMERMSSGPSRPRATPPPSRY